MDGAEEKEVAAGGGGHFDFGGEAIGGEGRPGVEVGAGLQHDLGAGLALEGPSKAAIGPRCERGKGEGGGGGDGDGVEGAAQADEADEASARVEASTLVHSVQRGASAGREAVLTHGGLEALSKVLREQSTDAQVVRDATRAIMALAAHDHTGRVLRGDGVAVCLSALDAQPEDVEVATAVLTTLREIALEHPNPLRTTRVVQATLRALTTFHDDEVVASRACGLFTNLTNDADRPLLAGLIAHDHDLAALCRAGVARAVVRALTKGFCPNCT